MWHENLNMCTSEKDIAIYKARKAAFQARESMLGHYVLANGIYDRVTHVWQGAEGFPATVQADGNCGSYYIDDTGVSYSGGLNSGYKIDDLYLSDETKPGRFWFFHNDFHTAHNAVYCEIDCRVYTLKGE